MSFDKERFKTNPNFRFKTLFSSNRDCLAGSCIFEVIKSKKDGKIYVISPYFNDEDEEQKNLIQILSLEDGKVVKELEGHDDRVLNVRYFRNEATQKEYLVSADRKYKVIVWDITDDYKLLKKTEFKYEGFIYSNALVFREDSIFLITSSINNQGTVKIVDVTKNEEPKDIASTKDFSVYYMEPWHNKKNGKDYLILCGKSKIKIIELFPDGPEQVTKEFNTNEKQPYSLGGLIYNYDGREFFIALSTFGGVLKIDLETMEQAGELQTFEECNFYNPVQWNERYLLFIDSFQRRIAVMDLRDNKIKSKMVFPELDCPRYMKKVNHPVYGEALLVVTLDRKIHLFTTRRITSFKE